MTRRATYIPSAIEEATHDVANGLSGLVCAAHLKNKPPMSEYEFRKLIAGYFENKSLRDWCELLGVEPPEGEP